MRRLKEIKDTISKDTISEGDTVTSSSALEDADLPYLPVRVALRSGMA